MANVKILKDRKTEEFFSEMYNSFVGYRQELFAQRVRDLRDKKVVSEEGEYPEFYVTKEDLINIARTI